MVITKCTHKRCQSTRDINSLTCGKCPHRFIEYVCPECGSKNPNLNLDIKLPTFIKKPMQTEG